MNGPSPPPPPPKVEGSVVSRCRDFHGNDWAAELARRGFVVTLLLDREAMK